MNKKVVSLLISLLLLTTCVLVFTYSDAIVTSVRYSLDIWLEQLIPSLFPFFFISEFLMEYGLVELLASLFQNFMSFLFHLKGETAFVFILSMISGFPSGAKYTKSLYEKGFINKEEANHLITFTHFANPLFILGLVSGILLKDKRIGLIILSVHYGTNFLIGILFRKKEKPQKKKTTLREGLSKMHYKRINNPLNFGQILTNAIFHTFQTLVLMLGIITFFLMVTSLCKEVLNLNQFPSAILSGLLEMTQGIYSVNNLAIPLNAKAILITFFLSFGGLSVHLQVYSLLSDTDIKYTSFFKARVLHALISSTLVMLLL